MMTLTQVSKTFPSHSIPADHGGEPVDVTLIAQLGHGAGDALIASTSKRQAQHPAFVDAAERFRATPASRRHTTNALAQYFGRTTRSTPF
jgi:hypothetical protein